MIEIDDYDYQARYMEKSMALTKAEMELARLNRIIDVMTYELGMDAKEKAKFLDDIK